MATSKEYNERMTAEATELVNQLMPLKVQFDALAERANNPVCGKPGMGFKAARLAQRKRNELAAQMAPIETAIDNWLTQNRKASMATRGKRFDYYTLAMQAWQPPS